MLYGPFLNSLFPFYLSVLRGSFSIRETQVHFPCIKLINEKKEMIIKTTMVFTVFVPNIWENTNNL